MRLQHATLGGGLPMQEITGAENLDTQFYLAAGDIVDVDIAEQDSASHGKRDAHRRVMRTSNGVVQRGLRRFGLWR